MKQLKITQQITKRENESLEKYLSEVAKYDMVTPQEEVELAKRIREGDDVALEKLVRANLRFVVSVAKQYQHAKMQLGDLINEGNIGLITAAQRFDETRGFKFISYAVWWIRQSIMKAIGENSRLIRVPVNRISDMNKIKKAFNELEQKYNREPSDEELAAVLDISEKEVRAVTSVFTGFVSLDKPVGEGETETLVNIIANNDAPDSDNKLMAESLQSEVQRFLNILPERERKVVEMAYGINAERQRATLDEIGYALGVSRERVRQLRESALRKLKKSSQKALLQKYL